MVNYDLVQAVKRIKLRLATEAEYLTKLDTAIGDGDHGRNLKRGWDAITIAELEGKSISEIFQIIGMAMVSQVGGASGPIYGTMFLEFAKVCNGLEIITIDDRVAMNEAAIAGIKRRGGAEFGDKTLLDVLIPFTTTLENTADFELSLEAAKTGSEDTKNYAAKKGRASYLGERSIGHIDPGCASMVIILEELL